MFDKIIRFALSYRFLVLTVAAVIVGYGTKVLVDLPVDVFPDLNRPIVNIMTEAPGFAPEEVEALITLPLETGLNGIPGVERIRSQSGVGLSVVYVEFAWNTDIYRNRQLVQEKLTIIQDKIPKNIVPIMGPIASIMGEIQLIGLSSPKQTVSPMELRTMADWTIRPRMLSIPGVSQVISIGGGVRQYQILLSAEKIQKYQLSIDDVEHNLSDISRNTTGGFIDIDKKEFLIRAVGAIKSKDDIQNSVVGIHLGVPVLVKDIAQVKELPRTKRGDASVNGTPAVILSIQKQPGASTIDLTKEIEKVIEQLKQNLPDDVKIDPHLFKQADFIKQSISNVEEALRDGVILVFIVLLLFLVNVRTTMITMMAIPLSFMLTAIVFKFFGLSVNTMTLGGLAIAIGELVDDAIVDIENVYRRLKENKIANNPRHYLRIIFEASSEVRNSIIIATIIVCLVFIPLFSMGGIEGRLFAPLGISYIISLLASMIVSLTVTPALASLWLAKGNLLTKEDGKLVRWLKKADRKLLEKLLPHPKKIILATIILFFTSLILASRMGKDFLPKFNEGTATITLMAEPGISLEESNRLGTEAENIILKTPEVKSVSRRTGRAELDEHAEGIHYSEMDVDFFNGEGKSTKMRSKEIILNEIRDHLGKLEGIFVNIGQPISHRLDHLLSGVRAQIAIKVFGPDLTMLRQKAAEIFDVLKDTPGLVDLQIEQQVLIPQVKIALLREEATKYGIILGDLAQLLQKTLQGEVVGQILENQKTIDVLMRFDEKSRSDLELIKKTPIKVMPDGSRIYLEEVADIYEANGPNIINRENAQRRIVIQANSNGRDIESLVNEVKNRIQKSVTMPQGHYITFGGQFEGQQQATKLMWLLGIMSLMGIFFVLLMYFKTPFMAWQVMFNIPMSFIGGVLGIYFTNGTISVASLVAFVTLCGIASRNGIMMLSHYLHLIKHEGEIFSKEMIIRGSQERLIPVLMTALTAILGLLPLALAGGLPGREILHPVAVVIVGGLLSSTLLDIVVTPTIFFHFGKNACAQSIELMNQKSVFELPETNGE